MSKKFMGLKEASEERNDNEFVWGRIKGGDIICCWLTSQGIIASR
jgi:hypothetical protein